MFFKLNLIIFTKNQRIGSFLKKTRNAKPIREFIIYYFFCSIFYTYFVTIALENETFITDDNGESFCVCSDVC